MAAAYFWYLGVPIIKVIRDVVVNSTAAMRWTMATKVRSRESSLMPKRFYTPEFQSEKRLA
jgi:hypothetical protein